MIRQVAHAILISLYLLAPPTPAAASSEVFLFHPDDPRLIRIIEGFKDAIVDLRHGMVGAIGQVKRLWRELAAILTEYNTDIDRQIEGSKCHNQSCTDYGVK